MRRGLVALLLAIAILSSFAIVSSAAPVEKPSVTRNEAPEVETISVINVDGEVVNTLPISTITVTPVSAADEELGETYDELCSVDSITELEGGADITEEIDSEYGEGTTEDLVVREVFDLEFSSEYDDYLQDGNTVVVKFDTNIPQDETLVVMIKVDGEWQVIPSKDIKVNADGSVEITFHEALNGVVTFMVDETPLGDMDVPSDDDSGSDHCTCILCKLLPSLCRLVCGNCSSWPICPCWLVLIAIILIIAFVVYEIKSRKNKEKK